jgi:hypothetical protein
LARQYQLSTLQRCPARRWATAEKGQIGPPGASAQRRVSDSKSGRCRRWGLLRQALSRNHVRKIYEMDIQSQTGGI